MAGVLFVIYFPAHKPGLWTPKISQGHPLTKTNASNEEQKETKQRANKENEPEVKQAEAEEKNQVEANDVRNVTRSSKEKINDIILQENEGKNISSEKDNKDKSDDNEKPSDLVDRTGKENDNHHHVTFVEKQDLNNALKTMLQNQGITNYIWTEKEDFMAKLTRDDSEIPHIVQVTFTLKTEECDRILYKLTELGIGLIPGTKVSIFPATIYYEGVEQPEEDKTRPEVTATQKSTMSKSSQAPGTDFFKSIKSRLTVAQVVEGVKNNSLLTFDFVMFITLASILAALGLAESSSVILVASMLVSPLMGPILGWIFGTVIGNRPLWTLGVKTEVIGLLLCLLCGFLFGLVTSAVNSKGAYWGATDSWPTDEMRSRGLIRSLWVGVLIALPSGAGVALSVLGGNSGSLVGVAISAALLPPAVNAGMLWAYALVTGISSPPVRQMQKVVVYNASTNGTFNTVTILAPNTEAKSGCPELLNNSYEFVYSCSMSTESFLLGLVSLFLTIMNIACIFVMGLIVLKIKEVAPHTASTSASHLFWRRDIKVARDSYKTLKSATALDLAKMAKQIVKDLAEKNKPATGESEEDILNKSLDGYAMLDDIVEEIAADNLADQVPQPIAQRRTVMRQISKEVNEALEEVLSEPRKAYLRAVNPHVLRHDRHSRQSLTPPSFFDFNPFPVTPRTPGPLAWTSPIHPLSADGIRKRPQSLPQAIIEEETVPLHPTPSIKLSTPKGRSSSLQGQTKIVAEKPEPEKDTLAASDGTSSSPEDIGGKEEKSSKRIFIVTPVNSSDTEGDIGDDKGDSKSEVQPLMK